jgi:hypothetical protein
MHIRVYFISGIILTLLLVASGALLVYAAPRLPAPAANQVIAPIYPVAQEPAEITATAGIPSDTITGTLPVTATSGVITTTSTPDLTAVPSLTFTLTITPSITLTPTFHLTSIFTVTGTQAHPPTTSAPTISPPVKPSATLTVTAKLAASPAAPTLTPTITPTPLPFIPFNPNLVARTLAYRLLVSLLILILGWFFTLVVRKVVTALLARVHPGIQVFMSRIAVISVWVLIFIFILGVFDVQVATLTAIIGTLGLALSLSSQDLFKNLIAGMYLLLERPFRIGDRISISISITNYTGQVEYIDIRTTKLRLDDGQVVIVPNTLILSQAIVIDKQSSTDEDQENPTETTPENTK